MPPCPLPPLAAAGTGRADVLMAEPLPRALPPATAAPARTETRLTIAELTGADAGGEVGARREVEALTETGIDATGTAVGTLTSGDTPEVGATMTKPGVATDTEIAIETATRTAIAVGIEIAAARVPDIERDHPTGRGGAASAKRERGPGRPRPPPMTGRGAMTRKEQVAVVGRREVGPL